MPHSPSVPSSFQGYHYQVVRLFTRLWNGSSGDVLCLEHFDDIVHKKDKGIITAEQAKLYLSANPASNWSPAFWNSIKNWIKLLESNPNLLSNIQFSYCCSSLEEPEELVPLYSDVSSDADFITAKERTLELLKSSRKKNKQEIIDLTNNPLFPSIIKKFSFIKEDPTDEDQIDRKLATFIPDQAQRVKAYLIGWIYNKVSTQFKQGIVMHIPYDDFIKEYKSFWNRLKANPLSVYSFVTSDSCTLEDREKYKNNIFMAQLDLIGCDKKDKETAIIDFITATNTWAKMAEEGAVNVESFQIFKDDIKSDWNDIKNIEIVRNKNLDKKDIGKIIYYKTRLLKIKLQGLECPNRFIEGTCQDLSDRLLIGWHPDYEKELSDD